MKHAAELAAALPSGMIRGSGDFAASGITADSRKVRPGLIYAAIPGVRNDGHDYLKAALEAGAAALLVSEPERGTIFQVRFPLGGKRLRMLGDSSLK